MVSYLDTYVDIVSLYVQCILAPTLHCTFTFAFNLTALPSFPGSQDMPRPTARRNPHNVHVPRKRLCGVPIYQCVYKKV